MPLCRLRRALQVLQRQFRPLDPIVILNRRRLDRLVGYAQHLQELARHLLLVVSGPVAKDQDRVGQHQLLAGPELALFLHLLRLRRGQLQAELRPVPTDDAIGFRAAGAEVIVQRGEILEIEDAAEIGFAEAEIHQAAVHPALGGLDIALRLCGVVILTQHIEVARDKRDMHRGRGDEVGHGAQAVQVGPAGAEAQPVLPQNAVDLQLQHLAGLRRHLATGEAGAVYIGRAQGQPAAALAPNEAPDRIATLTDLGLQITHKEATEPLHEAPLQLFPEAEDEGGKGRGLFEGGCLSHAAPAGRRAGSTADARVLFRRRTKNFGNLRQASGLRAKPG